MRRSSVRGVWLAAILLAGAVACNSDPKQEAVKHVARGDQYFGLNKLNEAVLEYRTAVANDPNSGDAHYKLAHAYMKRGDVREAYGEYVRAADLLPDRDDVQLNAGKLSLVARRYEDAKQRARAMLQHNPKSPQGLILMGNALAGLNDMQ